MPNGKPRPDPRTLFSDLMREMSGEPETAETPSVQELPTTPRDAFAQLMSSFQPQQVTVPSTRPTPITEFGAGFGEELIRPLTIFKSPGSDIDHEEEPFNISRLLGQFVGLGVGLIPFIKGPQAALRAFGIAKPFANFIGGSIGFGLFEAGAGTPEEAFERFAKGAAFGALFEGMFLKKAMREFNAARSFSTTVEEFSRSVSAEAIQSVDPMLAAVSAALNPRRYKANPEAFFATLAEIKDVERALDESFSKLAQVVSWEGRFTLGNIKSPSEFVRRINSANRNAKLDYSFYLDPDLQTFKAMVIDLKNPRSYLQRVYAKEIEQPFVRFGGSGLPVALDPDNMPALLRYLEAGLPEEAKTLVNNTFTVADIGRLTNARSTLGSARDALLPEIATSVAEDIAPRMLKMKPIRVARNLSDIEKVITLTHEFSHNVFNRRGWTNILRRIGVTQFDVTSQIEREALLDTVRGNAEILAKLELREKMTFFDYFEHLYDDAFRAEFGITDMNAALATWEAEMKAATERVLAINMSAADAASVVAGKASYYHRPDELLARFTELVLLNPNEARAVAPNFYDVFARIVSEESPKLKLLLSRGEPVRLLEWLEAGLAQAPPRVGFVQKIFTGTEDVYRVTEEMKAFFRKHGFVQGEEVSHEGINYIVQGAKGDVVTLRHAVTGELFVTDRKLVESTFISDVIQQRPDIRRRIMQAIRTPPKWLGVLLEDTRFTASDGSAGIRRAVIELEGFELLQAGEFETVQQAIKRWANRQVFGLGPRQQELKSVMANLEFGGPPSAEATEVLASLGLKGLLVRQEPGIYTVIAADRSAIRLGEDVLIEGAVGEVGGRVGDMWINVDVSTAMRSLLADAGASEAQMPYFMNRVRNDVINKALLNMVDDDVRGMLQRGESAVRMVKNQVALPEGIMRLNRGDLDLVQNADGTWSIVNRLTGVTEVTAKTGEEASSIFWKVPQGPSPIINTIELFQTEKFAGDVFKASENAGGMMKVTSEVMQSTRLADEVPLVTQEISWGQKIADAFVNMFPSFTALENFAKQVERQLGIPAYRNLFLPAQRAFQRVLLEFERTPQVFLDGRTYTQQLKLIQKVQKQVGRKRSHTVRGLIEVLSREEIEAGALSSLAEPMSEGALRLAREFERLGVNRDLARLTAQRQLILNALKHKENFLTRILPPLANRRDIDPIMRESIQRLKLMADDIPSTFDDVAKAIGLGENEILAMEKIDGILSGKIAEIGKTDLFQISRWGDAAPLAKGFKTARAQYIAEQGMSELEIKLAQEVQRMMYTGFGDFVTGSRMIAGYWGHLRKWVDAGFRPRKRGDMLREILPQDFMEWSEMRLRSGELDVYETDMVLLAYKIARALLMREHFDPQIKGFKQVLGTLRATDKRSHRIMNEYLDELIGVPHVSFRRLNDAVSRSMEIMGFSRPVRTAERMINNMTALAYGASIPFRISLILRNYYQMVQMIPARIGPRWFEKGLERAMTKEGFEEAVKAGAIPLGITPVFASTEALGHEVLRGADLRLRRLFEKGFDWYRKADDLGRAVAYHGQRQRLAHYYDQYARRLINYDTFKAKAKVNMFDTQDVAIFDDLMRQAKTEEAFDHLGFILSRETHFRYGAANHPAGWGSVPGRLFGQFGTWPVQYKDFLVTAAVRGSVKDKVEFAATHLGVNMGLVAAGAGMGMNLWNWASMPSLNYTGGPIADLSIDLIRVWNGSPAERAMARRSIMMQWPTLEDPRSIFVPGSYFIGDINSVFKEGDFDVQGLLEAGGFRFFEPEEKSGFEWLWDY